MIQWTITVKNCEVIKLVNNITKTNNLGENFKSETMDSNNKINYEYIKLVNYITKTNNLVRPACLSLE